MDLPFLSGLSNIDMLILLGAVIVFLVMAYMIFKQIMKAIIIGVIFGAIPIALYLVGFEIPLSIQTIVWFALLGIAMYFVYDVISGWMRIMRIITWPIRRLFRKGSKEQKVQVKEEKKDKGKEKKSNQGKEDDYEEVK
jgi:CBS domain containing-hemolysin-like protein